MSLGFKKFKVYGGNRRREGNMAAEVFSTVVPSLPDEAASPGTDSDYRGETAVSLSVEEGTQTSCVLMQEMKR